MRCPVLDELGKRILVVDGGMGTMIQSMGVEVKGPPEILNETHQDIIYSIHKAYVEAGADIIETNSFGSSRIKLSNYGLEEKAYYLSRRAAEIARRAAGDRVLVAGSVGPLGKILRPVGNVDFDEAYEAFYEQIKGLRDGGVDLIFVETMSDVREAKAAILAAKDQGLPVVALMTFQEDGRTLLGVTPEVAAVSLSAMDVVAVGANCSTGPDRMLDVARKMASVTSKPLIFMPNAGVPRFENGKTVFPLDAESFARYAPEFVEAGAWIIGGCCGTTPSHIKRLREVLSGVRPVVRREDPSLKVAGRDGVVFIGNRHYPVVVGERINPTGKKEFQKDLVEKKATWAIKAALSQKEAGAQILDVNVGMGGINEVELLPFICASVQTATGLPVMVDSSDPCAVEAALKVVDGRPVINSTTLEAKKLEQVVPLASRYGAALLVLPMDEGGIPDTPEGRVALGERAVEVASSAGLGVQDLILDCLVMAVSADEKAAMVTLDTVRLAKSKGFHTILGVSNISFGLPARSIINAAFLSAALCYGLDAAIINPEDERVMGALRAGALLAGRDPGARVYVSIAAGVAKEDKRAQLRLSDEDMLKECVIEGDDAKAVELTKRLLEKHKPLEIINNILVPAMEEVGRRYEKGVFFLPQLMAAAKAMKGAFQVIKEAFKDKPRDVKGTIVLATVEGDIHDIGKNIVAMLLENHGYKVIDLGKNVPKEKIVEEAKRVKPDAVGLSALMTTTMMEMKNVIEALKREGIKVFTMVGGAVVTEEFAKNIGADAYAENAVEAVKIMDRWMEEKSGKDLTGDSGSGSGDERGGSADR